MPTLTVSAHEDPRLSKLREIDDALGEKGWPKISPWWWRVIEEFYSSGVLGCVIQGGRRGGKSATLAAKITLAELLTEVANERGELQPLHAVPPGDIGYFAMISAEKPQAKARVATCKKALQALGYEFSKETTEELILKGTRLGVLAVTATLSGVVSFTCIGALLDEMALWKDGDSDANPADEVVRSLKPTMATMPNARAWYVSAPWAELGLHWDMMQAGNDETQRVYQGATWEMNPTLSQAATRLLEKDFVTWMRAYGAVAMKSDASKFFSAEFIDACRLAHGAFVAERIAAGGDFAFRRDSSAMVALARDGARLRVVAAEERLPGARALKPSATIVDLISIATSRGADSIACDLHYIETVREHADDLEIDLLEYPSHDNDTWYVRLRVLLSEGAIDLRDAPQSLIDQLKACTGKPLDGGRMKIEVKRGEGLAHGDMLSALVCAVWAIDQPPGETVNAGKRRYGRGEAPKREEWDGPAMKNWP